MTWRLLLSGATMLRQTRNGRDDVIGGVAAHEPGSRRAAPTPHHGDHWGRLEMPCRGCPPKSAEHTFRVGYLRAAFASFSPFQRLNNAQGELAGTHGPVHSSLPPHSYLALDMKTLVSVVRLSGLEPLEAYSRPSGRAGRQQQGSNCLEMYSLVRRQVVLLAITQYGTIGKEAAKDRESSCIGPPRMLGEKKCTVHVIRQ